jgi:hypothetical protein
MKRLLAVLIILASLVVSAKAYENRPNLGLGIGFTLDPETFLIGGKLDVPLAYGFSLGPLVQIGLSDDDQLYGFSGNLKYTISIPDAPKLLPSLEAGIGVLVSHKDTPRDDDTEAAFLIVLGGGLDYMITDHIGVGAHVYANPAIDHGEDFFASFLFGMNFRL